MDRIERYYLRQSEGGFATPGFICNNRKCLENDPLFTNGGIITTPRKNNNNKKRRVLLKDTKCVKVVSV